MKSVVLFGAGFYGDAAYYKLRNVVDIQYFIDNDPEKIGEHLHGIKIIDIDQLREIISKQAIDIIISSQYHTEIAEQLYDIGVKDYYIILGGLLFHTNETDKMLPFELAETQIYIKEKTEKNILFVQDTACIRTHKIASLMKDNGYKVFLLYTMAPPESNNMSFASVYDNIYTFYTYNALVNFVRQSQFDIVHCSNAPDMLACLLLNTSKRIVFDTHDMNSLWGHDSLENLTFEFIANTRSDGNIYTSQGVADIAQRKYELENKEILSLENMILDQEEIINPHEKLSGIDNQIHCVYEGGINGKDKESDRFFENIWKKITDCGIHIHFYSQSDPAYCKKLEKKNKYLHYEGNMGSKELVKEMTKYDCGLAIFHVTNKNREFMETGTANKVYEYLNSQIPVIVSELKSYCAFVEKYNVGINLDFTKDIKKQISRACQIHISPDFLKEHNLTMKSRVSEIVDFYERVKNKET
jgi:hypothetical protein